MQQQALPVSSAPLDGTVPTTGEEFLRYARDEAAREPAVKTAKSQSASTIQPSSNCPSWKFAFDQFKTSKDGIISNDNNRSRVKVDAEWNVTFGARYGAIKRSMMTQRRNLFKSNDVISRSIKDEYEFLQICESECHTALRMIAQMDQGNLMKMLELMNGNLVETRNLTENISKVLFSILGFVDIVLTGDELAVIRQTAYTLKDLRSDPLASEDLIGWTNILIFIVHNEFKQFDIN